MSRELAAVLCGLLLVACSPESEPNEADHANNRAPEPVPTSTAEESPNGAPTIQDYSGRKCFGYQPTILGTHGDDLIRATRANDVIITLGGNDVVIGPGRKAWDRICTGTGDDRVVYEGDHVYPDDIRISLGPGDDRMTVTDPVLKVGIIVAGRGDDTILFARRSWAVVAPGPGRDLIRASDARGLYRTTCIDLRRAPGPVRINLARGRATGQGHDRFDNVRCAFGGRFNDVLLGTPRNDRLDGGGGLDLMRAGAGNDDASGGFSTFSATSSNVTSDRADEVYLGPGNDLGYGDLGWDKLYGGPGSDDITGDYGGDYLDGGPGDDYLYSGLGCSDTFESSPAANEEMLTQNWHWDADGNWTRVPPEPNEVFGGSGNDFLAGDRGNDRLDGGLGFDSGTGGYYDGRIDWITSVERPDNCDSRF